jgi:hypothetical protein
MKNQYHWSKVLHSTQCFDIMCQAQQAYTFDIKGIRELARCQSWHCYLLWCWADQFFTFSFFIVNNSLCSYTVYCDLWSFRVLARGLSEQVLRSPRGTNEERFNIQRRPGCQRAQAVPSVRPLSSTTSVGRKRNRQRRQSASLSTPLERARKYVLTLSRESSRLEIESRESTVDMWIRMRRDVRR